MSSSGQGPGTVSGSADTEAKQQMAPCTQGGRGQGRQPRTHRILGSWQRGGAEEAESEVAGTSHVTLK